MFFLNKTCFSFLGSFSRKITCKGAINKIWNRAKYLNLWQSTSHLAQHLSSTSITVEQFINFFCFLKNFWCFLIVRFDYTPTPSLPMHHPRPQDLNWICVRRSEDVQDVFLTLYVYLIYALCPRGCYEVEIFLKFA